MSVTVNRTAQRYSSGSQATPRMVLLHTTEGMGWPGYGGGSSAPHATIKPIPGKGIEVREHIPFGQFAKALQNRSGGVQTNTSGVLQFELMGTCDERTASRAYYWPRADDAVLQALADYLRPIMATYGIPHTSDVTWKSYNRGQVPSSYGLSNGVRMSFAKWGTFRGICGHQHAPENDHGDPGDFPISTLLRYLSGASAATPAKTTSTQTYTREDVARLQRVLGLEDDGLWGNLTEKQAQAIRRCLKPGMKRSAWDRLRYWRLRVSRPAGKQTSDSMRRAHQWALNVKVDGIWGEATDAAWLAMRQEHKR